ncbi:MAG: sulfatase-like hydrolase/transferase [Planctomycetaceae bacterium]
MRAALGVLFACLSATAHAAAPSGRPNVVIVITDDQGYGELSCHGNPVLQTPNLDRLHRESVRFVDFHVAPMCTATRGQLMTGVDALRNGAMNVSSGRTPLRKELPTLGDVYRASGYGTGLYGKRHLGDTFPYRPQDRGFGESLWFPSSHLGSVPDAWGNDYFDDTYIRNGRRTPPKGYTTDMLFREATLWMKRESEAGRPFFCYLAPAAPHQPHFVPARYREQIRVAFEATRGKLRHSDPDAPWGDGQTLEKELTGFLAMVANIDENIGRLDHFLAEQGLRDDTLLVFLTDNGSSFGPRYFNAGMKGGKTSLWEGGHRVPCFVRWPGGGLRPAGDVDGVTEVQDILPTLVELLDLDLPPEASFDGISLADVVRGRAEVPADRSVVINFSRMPIGAMRSAPGSAAVPRREGAAVLWKCWRLLGVTELYPLDEDPLQERNVIGQHPDLAAQLLTRLDAWWEGIAGRANEFQAIVIGHPAENPVTLTACEWADVFLDQQAQVRRGERKNGIWHVEVAETGEYAFRLSRWPYAAGLGLADGTPATRVTDGDLPAGDAWPVATARLSVDDIVRTASVIPGAWSVRFVVPLVAGRTTLETTLLDAAGGEIAGAYYVTAERISRPAQLVPLILDTDMSGDCDDAGTLAVLHALADRSECELLAVVTNRRDLANASAAAVDAINTFYCRPDLPLGVGREPPTALQRTSPFTPAIRDGFPHDTTTDDKMPDALEVYRTVLVAQPDGSVTICSVGAFSNLAELCRREPDLVKNKVARLVVMGGQFPPGNTPETNVATHPAAAAFVAREWPTEIVWQGFEVGDPVITGDGLKDTPRANPVRRAYELRRYGGRASIDGGQPSYDQAAALYAVRGYDQELWREERGGRVAVDDTGLTRWRANAGGQHVLVQRACDPEVLAERIEALMIAPPSTTGDTSDWK